MFWDDARSYFGRIVRLDSASRVVYAPASGKQNFAPEVATGTMTLLIPFTGVGMRRAASNYREQMPECMLRLARFCSSLHDSKAGDDEGPACLLCSLPCNDSAEGFAIEALARLAGSGVDIAGLKHVAELVTALPETRRCVCAWCGALVDQVCPD